MEKKTYELYPKNSRGWWFSRIACTETRIAAFQHFYEIPANPQYSLLDNCINLGDALAGFVWDKTSEGYIHWDKVGRNPDGLLDLTYYEIDQMFKPIVKQGDEFTIRDNSKFISNFSTNYDYIYKVDRIEYDQMSWKIHIQSVGWIHSSKPMNQAIKKHTLTTKISESMSFSVGDRVRSKSSGTEYVYAADHGAGWCYVELLESAPGAFKKDSYPYYLRNYTPQVTGLFKTLKTDGLIRATDSDESIHGSGLDPFFDDYRPDGHQTYAPDDSRPISLSTSSVSEALRRGYWPGTIIKPIVTISIPSVTLGSTPSIHGTDVVAKSINKVDSYYICRNGKWAEIVQKGKLTADIIEMLGFVPGVWFRSAYSGEVVQYKEDLYIADSESVTCRAQSTDGSFVNAYICYHGKWATITETPNQVKKEPKEEPTQKGSILNWLMSIPDQRIKNKAIEYLFNPKVKGGVPTQVCTGFSPALNVAFKFSLTDEGYDYWAGIAKQYANLQLDLKSQEKSNQHGDKNSYSGQSVQAHRPTADVRRGPEITGNIAQGSKPRVAIEVGYLSHTEVTG